MRRSELAQLMLEFETAQSQADSIKARIVTAVLDLGKTQTVGNVRASYSAGRKTYDYKGAVGDRRDQHTASIIMACTTTVTDWREVCKRAQIEPPVLTKGEPSVSLKLME